MGAFGRWIISPWYHVYVIHDVCDMNVHPRNGSFPWGGRED